MKTEEGSSTTRLWLTSPRLLGFLDHHFHSPRDLHNLPSFLSHLRLQCRDLESDLVHLEEKLSSASNAWISRSDEVRGVLRGTRGVLLDDALGGGLDGDLGMNVSRLVGEVGRIETVRLYAETTLQLEALVGDLEDAALSMVSQSSRSTRSFVLLRESTPKETALKHEKVLLAVHVMKSIENVLARVSNNRPRWTRLIIAVDSRVDRTVAFLRPQALMDHRALLASLGWPPSLTTSNDKSLDIPNPLVLMQGERKKEYSLSFLALCALQHVQAKRDARQNCHVRCRKDLKFSDSLVDSEKNLSLDQGLWTINELAYPIAAKMEYHFSRWTGQPKFIFALVLKITREFLDGVDYVLQPLIDRALVVGYSAKEAWVSAMIKILSDYLKSKIFPGLAKSYAGRDGHVEINSSWLQLVDLMISFDKRMKVLASTGSSLMVTFAEFEEFPQSLSLISVLCGNPNWLQIWAEIELKDADEKIRSELEDERSWWMDVKKESDFSHKGGPESFLLSTREDYKAPFVAESVIKIAWAMLERAQSIPTLSRKFQFIKSSLTVFLSHFFNILQGHSQEIIDIVDDGVLQRVVSSVNAARYCESILREWSEDVTLVEISAHQDDLTRGTADQHLPSCLFRDEILYLVKFETDSIVEIMSALLLEFDALSWEYVQKRELRGQEQTEYDETLDEENRSVSPEFVEALDMLNDRIRFLKLYLNSKDFLDLWRSIAGGLDHFIFTSIPSSDVQFSLRGIKQFKADMRALFHIFGPLCARPVAFFPCISDSLKLLGLHRKDLDSLLKFISKSEQEMDKCLQVRGLFNLSAHQAEKVLRNMKAS